jgi:ABC-type multidrug transport system ATPase subunit
MEYYARIKGIPYKYRVGLVDSMLIELDLEEFRGKAAGTLSGGNKRKLAVGIAIIGNPTIILLDEPSAGMDPQARRFLWSVISRRKDSAVVLSSHAMAEAEALSTRMGIMV